MSPRPRETSDEELLAATARVMQRCSPVDLTLAEVAKEAGVVPATLIQRFGTKRQLLLANCKAWTASVSDQFAAARKKHDSPLRALVECFVECSHFAASPDAVANSLAYLQIDLTDPEFYAVLLAQSVTLHQETKRLLDSAVAVGQLRPCDTAALASLVQQVDSGAMLEWAVYRKGSLAGWIRRSLQTLLRPYRPAAEQTKRKRNERSS